MLLARLTLALLLLATGCRFSKGLGGQEGEELDDYGLDSPDSDMDTDTDADTDADTDHTSDTAARR